MAEVIIDDSSLNAIANSIRFKNGLVRTYKPHEMAPAILALRGFAPSSHGYTVRIRQTPHQQITVRQFQTPQIKDFQNSFTVSEPVWKFLATIEAEAGYEAGVLNYPNETTIDRDFIIEATPAVPIDVSANWTTVYLNGTRGALWGNGSQQDTWFWYHYRDHDCTNSYGNSTASGKVIFQDVTSGVSDGRSIFGNTQWGSCDQYWRGGGITEAVCRVNAENFTNMHYCYRNLYSMIKVDVQAMNPVNCANFNYMFLDCTSLRRISGIQYWRPSELIYADGMFSGCSQLFSLDLSGWNTPKLVSASGMFSGCSVLYNLDISNWDTGYIQAFNAPPNAKFIIMDDQRSVKFNGDYIFPNPNNKVKYLVPTNMVELYKAHPNWSSRASQIEDVSTHTITRIDGQVYVDEII